ncbi:MAG: FAD-binding protein [Thermomicrobiales bacterium]
MSWRNWAGNVNASPAEIIASKSLDDLRRAVARATRTGLRVRVAGTGHSFAPLCATDGLLIDLAGLAGIESVDPHTGVATILAGTKLHAIGEPLLRAGRALPNQGDIDRQALAGAVATGTHGTGRTVGSFFFDGAGSGTPDIERRPGHDRHQPGGRFAGRRPQPRHARSGHPSPDNHGSSVSPARTIAASRFRNVSGCVSCG